MRSRSIFAPSLAALMCCAGVLPALADDLVRPFAATDTAAAPRSAGGSIFAFAAPSQRATEASVAAGVPLDITPSQAALAAAATALAQAPKPANVPLPPRIERARPAAGERTEVATTETPKAQNEPAPEPAKTLPAQGGFFSWLARQNDEPVVTDRQEVASLSPVIGARRADPAPKLVPGETPADDDLEDEETRKLVEKQAPHVEIACLKPRLMRLIHAAGEHFKGTPVITSGFRNRGRRGSYHRKCEAADFFITGVSGGQLTSFLRKLPGAGGVGTYCHTKSVHIDTGDARDWHQCGFRRRFALREPVVAAQIGSRQTR